MTAAFGFLNTRPSHQAVSLTQQLTELGGQVFACPQIEIEFCQPSPANFAEVDALVFTSVNAVTGFLALHAPEVLTAKQVFAIGHATRQALLATGIAVDLPAGRFDSETLLQLPSLQSIRGRRFLLVKGEGGRALIAQTLNARGAEVMPYEVYRRRALPFCFEAWQAFQSHVKPIILATSVESLQNLLNNVALHVKKHQAWCFQQSLLVFSVRIAAAARDQGWQGDIWVVEQQSDAGILAVLERQFKRKGKGL